MSPRARSAGASAALGVMPVSYTHLDVYKRQIHVLGVGVGDLGDLLLGCRSDREEGLAVTLDELPVDEEPVALLQVQDEMCIRDSARTSLRLIALSGADC